MKHRVLVQLMDAQNQVLQLASQDCNPYSETSIQRAAMGAASAIKPLTLPPIDRQTIIAKLRALEVFLTNRSDRTFFETIDQTKRDIGQIIDQIRFGEI